MKLVLRACAAPLRPEHLARFLVDQAGAGMSLKESIHMDETYHEVAKEAFDITIQDDPIYQKAIEKHVVQTLRKPLSKMGVRNQFLALSPSIEFATVSKRVPESDPQPEHLDEGGEVRARWTMHLANGQERPDEILQADAEAMLGELHPRPFVLTFDMLARLEKMRIAGGERISRAKLQGFVEQHAGAACVFLFQA